MSNSIWFFLLVAKAGEVDGDVGVLRVGADAEHLQATEGLAVVAGTRADCEVLVASGVFCLKPSAEEVEPAMEIKLPRWKRSAARLQEESRPPADAALLYSSTSG